MVSRKTALLTEMVGDGGAQIPLLSDVIDDTVEPESEPAQIPLVGIAPAPITEKAPDALLVHLDKELRPPPR